MSGSESEAETPDLQWDEQRGSLGLTPELFRFPAPPGDKTLTVDDRRGASRDRYGNWYWLSDDELEIRFLSLASQQAEHFWTSSDLIKSPEAEIEPGGFQPIEPPPPPDPLQLRGLAVTEYHYLVVGVLDPAGILVFDLHAGGPPLQITWPSEVPFRPFDIAPAPDGGAWILDFDPDQPDEARYWALDRYFRLIAVDQEETTLEPAGVDDFQPKEGETRGRPRRSFPTGISLTMSSPLTAQNPIAIEALPDGTVLILENEPEANQVLLSRYRFGQQLGPTVSLSDETILPVSGVFTLQGHDMAVVADHSQAAVEQISGTLYLATTDGNQAYAYRFTADDLNETLEVLLIMNYFPMRLYSGKALVMVDDTVYYDLQERWLPLVNQPRPRYKSAGQLLTQIFDGREHDCTWHRLFVDACIPPGASVRVESRAANDPALISAAAWQVEPSLYRRATGSDLPYHQPYSPEEAARDGVGTWELLFQRAQGRYIQLRLSFQGTQRNTPWLRALRLYYPRFSLLQAYLPAAYQFDQASASFLDRFLANFEGTYTVIEGKIEQAQRLFDAHTAPAEYMDWLVGWFNISFDEAWEEARRRLFISHAIELFNQRGTVAGIIRAVRLALDSCPDETLFSKDVTACSIGSTTACAGGSQSARFSVRIVERFLTRGAAGVVYGDPTDMVGPGLTSATNDWTPAQGATPLHQRYRQYLRERYGTIEALQESWPDTSYTSFYQILLSPVLPTGGPDSAIAVDWRDFIQRSLGFTYAEVTAADQTSYQLFLTRRYRQIDRLNDAYPQNYAGFSAIKLPEENDFPTGGPRLYDWIQFVSLLLPIKRRAHQFTVLVPTFLQDDREVQTQQLELARRVVELEKPVHTSFEVKQYWALFRVDEARLGLDTVLDVGSRFTALMLGQGYLTEGYLTTTEPWNVPDRFVTGRNQAGEEVTL